MTANLNYIIALMIMFISLYAIIINGNLIKKLLALSIFQTSILLFFVSIAKIHGGLPPILKCLDFTKCPAVYANPLPHVLMLTAIVVGVATLSVGLAIAVKIRTDIGSIEEFEIKKELSK